MEPVLDNARRVERAVAAVGVVNASLRKLRHMAHHRIDIAGAGSKSCATERGLTCLEAYIT